MIRYYYVIEDGVFLVKGIHNIPEGAIPVSDELFKELTEGRNNGYTIELPDAEHDILWLKPRPEPTELELLQARKYEIQESFKEFDYIDVVFDDAKNHVKPADFQATFGVANQDALAAKYKTKIEERLALRAENTKIEARIAELEAQNG